MLGEDTVRKRGLGTPRTVSRPHDKDGSGTTSVIVDIKLTRVAHHGATASTGVALAAGIDRQGKRRSP